MRTCDLARETAETRIALSLNLDGYGEFAINTGCGFLNHMLELFARHGRFDLRVTCKGDTDVDYHHTTEDVAIVLGQAFARALGECRGIARYGSVTLPMDEALIAVALDISGRAYLACDVTIPAQKVGDFDTELAEEFMMGFCRNAGITLHIKQWAGTNSHHIIEGMFKGLARALRMAVAVDTAFADEIPSTKGTIV